MATMKCKKCGASIVIEAGKNVVRCKSCGTMQVVSNDNDKQKQFAQRRRLAARLGKTIAAGYWYSVGLKTDGTVVAVGANERGQCNTRDWTDVTAVSAGKDQCFGLKADGTVYASQRTDYYTFSYCNVEKWKGIVAIAAEKDYIVGLKKDGTVIASGHIKNSDDSRGLYFDDDGTVSLSGVTFHHIENGKIVGNDDGLDKFEKVRMTYDTEDWTDIVAIAAGGSQAVGLKANGTVVAMGCTEDGACDTADWRDIVAIAAGGQHTIGLKDNGTVVAVGRNEDGACNVSKWRDIVAVAGGLDHTVGLKADGTVVAVGSNEKGQCNTDAWKNVVAIAAGYYHTLGLCADGTLVAVGESQTYDVRGGNKACDVAGWKLFDSIDTLDQELDVAKKAMEENTAKKQAVLDSIKKLCNEFQKNHYGSAVWNADKLKSGISSKLDDDDIYLAYDNSGSNYGEAGFAITRLGIYSCSPKKDNHVDFETLANAKTIKKKGGGKIYADEELIGICTKGSMSKAIIKLFTDIAHAALPIAKTQAPTKAKSKKRVKLPLLLIWPIFMAIMLALILVAGLNNGVTQLLAAIAMAGTLEAIVYRIGPGWFLRLLLAAIGGYAGLLGWMAIIGWPDITPPVGVGMITWFAVVIDIVIGKYKLADH